MEKKGLPALFTLDAGANVHVITLSEFTKKVVTKLQAIPGVSQVLVAGVGSGVKIEKSI